MVGGTGDAGAAGGVGRLVPSLLPKTSRRSGQKSVSQTEIQTPFPLETWCLKKQWNRLFGQICPFLPFKNRFPKITYSNKFQNNLFEFRCVTFVSLVRGTLIVQYQIMRFECFWYWFLWIFVWHTISVSIIEFRQVSRNESTSLSPIIGGNLFVSCFWIWSLQLFSSNLTLVSIRLGITGESIVFWTFPSQLGSQIWRSWT